MTENAAPGEWALFIVTMFLMALFTLGMIDIYLEDDSREYRCDVEADVGV